jgi:hypothetical protein
MPRRTKTLDEQIRAAKLRVLELEEEYKTQLYLETMPEYSPTYEYSYDKSNLSIPFEKQHIDYWLRAVVRHMANRKTGHGGASTSAVLVSIPVGYTEAQIDEWLIYATERIKKAALKHKSRSKNG